ncbi:type I polyketide synthase [Nocardia aurantiaca]|uniref:Acyltransferase domain-containing protein n=1 Tax=Nocardia aurantiaca TaxID=2675850 RepID=A0A6I3L947_9NOCA|nr:type I polyketide synthase [Nocardia aurantiaca]MTE16389.1 acyltransferase domain-containing protein [Nocardia aurantiaca]
MIAIIGMACHVPGAHGIDEFWQLLLDGIDAITEIPITRFPIDQFYQPGGPAAGKIITTAGGFLDNIDGFDADFFGVSPREAEAMDPQQRLLLECAWEAIEDAGLTREQLAGSRTGVFVGTDSSNYWELQNRGKPTIYGVMGGGARSAIAGRLSFAFDLNGPALAVDAACASSLSALNVAVQSLRSGESSMAIAAGAHLVLSPWESVAFSSAGMLSPEGRCKFGDRDADGFVRSEGIAAVILKPLPAALADGDPIHAVIRGVGSSNDGMGSGLFMAPAVSGQVDMLRNAYADAGIDPATVDFVEAHGTGTQAGDPVELKAIGTVLGAGRTRRLLVGSHKTNIGHSEAAAGLIGVIKAVLCLRHRTVPGNLHLRTPNPAIPWEELPLTLPSMATPLDDDKRLVAGVSGFGVSGTNVHVVLTEVDPAVATRVRHADAALAETGDAQLLTLSAQSHEALRDLVRFHLTYLGPRGAGRHEDIRDIAYTAAARRTHHDRRLAVVGATHDELIEQLRAVLHGDTEFVAHDRPRVAFVFPGQGSQWPGMCRELLEVSPAFRHAMVRCDAAIRAESGWSVLELLRDGAELTGIDVVQPTLWAVEIALAETWRAWGVEPDLVIGHSMGEAAAAHIAGALSLEDAAAVICRRSALMRRVAGQGAMAVVGLSIDSARELIAEVSTKVSVAVSNSPKTTVLSGDPQVLAELKTTLEARDVFCQMVKVDVASHSVQMDPVLDELVEALGAITPLAGRIPVHSTVLGQPVAGIDLDAAYWARNLREPVQFSAVVRAAAAERPTVFVEISPHPMLVQAIRENIADLGVTGEAVGSQRRGQPERATLLAGLATLYARNAPMSLSRLYSGGRCVPLPHYPWQRERFWLSEADTTVTSTVLGRDITLDTTAAPYLLEHVVNGVRLVPGTVFLDRVRQFGREAAGGLPVALSDVEFVAALVLTPGEIRSLRVELMPTEFGVWRFTVTAPESPGGPVVEHCRGTVRTGSIPPQAHRPLDEIRARLDGQCTGAGFYARAEEGGTAWGPSFLALTELWHGPGEALARFELPTALVADPEAAQAHPALLEACAAPVLALFDEPVWMIADQLELARFGEAPIRQGWTHVKVTSSPTPSTVIADVTVFDDQELIVAELTGLRVRPTVTHLPEIPSPTELSAQPATASRPEPGAAAGGGLSVEVRGELRIRDAASRTVLELSGSLAFHPDGMSFGTAPTELTAALPNSLTSAPITAGAPAARVTVPTAPAPASAPVPVRQSANGRPVVGAPDAGSATKTLTTPAVTAPNDIAPIAASRQPDSSPEAVLESLIGQIAAVTRRPAAKIDARRTATEIGMDSLMSLEVKSHLQQAFGVTIPAKLLLEADSLRAAAEQIAALAAPDGSNAP